MQVFPSAFQAENRTMCSGYLYNIYHDYSQIYLLEEIVFF